MTAPLDEKEAVELKVSDAESPEIIAVPDEPHEQAPESIPSVDFTPPETGLPSFGEGFETISLLESDGYGELYKIHNERMGKDMCARLIPSGKFHNEESRKAFLRFCRRYITVTHPSMVPLYSFHDDAKGVWFMMDSIDGPSLQNWIDNGEFKSSAKIADVFGQLTECIKALHKVGIRFGAMHPAGIFIVDNGHGHTIQLRDWWAYALLQAQEGQTHPQQMPYASPEQVQGDGKLDERADIYTYGAMLYEALSGKTPFAHPDSLKMAIKIMKDATPKVEGQFAGTPFAQVAERCLQKDASDRYQTFEELEDDLNCAGRGAPLKSLDTTKQATIGSSTRRIALMTAIAMVVLAWITSFYLALLRESTGGPPFIDPPVNQTDTQTIQDAAQKLEDDGKYTEAEPLWQTAVDQTPNDAYLQMRLGFCQTQTHKHAEALTHLQLASSLDPTMPEPWLYMGSEKESLGQADAAISDLKKAIDLNPDDADSWTTLSYTYSSAGKFKDAIDAAKQAVKLDPSDFHGQFNLGIGYYGDNQFQNALEAFNAALQQSRDDPAIWTNLSLTYVKLGKFGEATAAAQAAVNLDPHEVTYAANLAHTYAAAGNYHRAEEAYRHALNLDRFDGATWAGLADVLEKLGRKGDAAEARSHISE
jgi:tetratricopeptide (TPR) repeat protein